MPSGFAEMSRRAFVGRGLQAAGAVSAACITRRVVGQSSAIALLLAKSAAVPLAADFTGLGYEMSSPARPGLLSAENVRYARLVKQLGVRGVIRVGGIVANYTRYEPDGTPKTEPKDTVMTRAALEQFAGFLRATGWTAIWSVNFAQGTLEEAVAEASAVAAVLGDRLQSIELGNEVEDIDKGAKPFRTPPYTFEKYRAEYARWRAALLAAVPGLRFAAPDTAHSTEWVEQMAAGAHGNVQLLTTHYYRGGQTKATAEQLQQPDPNLPATLARLRVAAQTSGIPWRMCETNSFFGGGRPGLSDTLLGALWTLDYMLLLAVSGCSGVNMETGVNQLGFISSYSPIQDDEHGVQSAGVPYYGMLAFAEAARGCTEVHAVDVPGETEGLTAYALGQSGRVRSVVVVNRGAVDRPVSCSSLGLRRAEKMELRGPSLESTSGVSFAGASVAADGSWRPGLPPDKGRGAVMVKAGSATVLRAV